MESCIHREVYVQFGERTARITITYIVYSAFLLHHNRGSSGYFQKLKNVSEGDEITYTTTLGTRNYIVQSVGRISETDWTKLEYTNDNRLTLITCVEDVPNQRLCVQAVEKR